MSPRTLEQYEEIRAERRKLITETSLKLFAEHGYENVSISKIAGNAKISKGLLYNYFESKEALLNTILEEGYTGIMQNFDLDDNGVLDQDELLYYIEEIFKTVKDNISYWKLYFAVSMQPAVFKIFAPQIREKITPMINMLTKYFEKEGLSDPVLESIFFASLLDGIFLQYIFDPENFPLKKVKEKVISLYRKKVK